MGPILSELGRGQPSLAIQDQGASAEGSGDTGENKDGLSGGLSGAPLLPPICFSPGYFSPHPQKPPQPLSPGSILRAECSPRRPERCTPLFLSYHRSPKELHKSNPDATHVTAEGSEANSSRDQEVKQHGQISFPKASGLR